MEKQIGRSKLVLKYLGFLLKEYNMQFRAQEFHEYIGFHTLIYTYSFYNDNGCFTIHDAQQRGETGWFLSKAFSEDQYELLEREIIQVLYIQGNCWLFRTGIKKLAASIRSQIDRSGSFFDLQVEKKKA